MKPEDQPAAAAAAGADQTATNKTDGATDKAQDFSSAFAEAAKAVGGEAAAAPADDKPAGGDANTAGAAGAGKDDAKPADGAATAAAGTQDGSSGSAAQPGAAETGKDAKDGGTAGQPRDPRGRFAKVELDETWKDAPEPLRTAHQAVLHRNAGLSEQVVRRTRENDKLKGDLEAARRRAEQAEAELRRRGATTTAKPADAPAGAAKTDNKDPAAKPAGQISDDDLDKIEKEYPEFAALVANVREHKATRSEIAELKQQLAAMQGRETKRTEEAQVEEEFNSLIDVHPDWLLLTGQSPEDVEALTGKPAPGYDEKTARENHQRFTAWFDAQPKYVRDAAKRNANRIVDAEAAIDLMDRYKEHLRRTGHATANPDPKPADTAPKAGAAGDPKPKPDLSAKRQEQLRGSTSVPNRGPVAAAPSEDDFSSAFKAAAAKAAQESRART